MLNIYLSVLGITGNVVAVDGKRTAAVPAFAWGIKSATTIHLYASGGNTALIADLSAYSWVMAMAKDWNPATPPAYRIDSTVITVVANALVMDVTPNTAEMLAVLGVSPVANIKAELIGYQGGVAVRTIQFPVSVGNRVDGTGDPEELVPNYYDKQVIDDKFANVGTAIPAATEGARGTIALATAAEAAAGTDPNKAITAATLKPLVDAKENVANKTQAIDAVTPSADKYTSEAAVVDYVAGVTGDIEAVLDELIGGAP
jgi:hypothetical protein